MDNQHRKITGYRELSQQEIDFMNKSKAMAVQVGALIDEIEASGVQDGRWLSIAKTDLQKGFMSLTRSVAKPETF